jgi:hypothetical protein
MGIAFSKNETEPARTNTRERTTFLTLPHELRQYIIYESIADGQIHPPFDRDITKVRSMIKLWAARLREVDPDIIGDVDEVQQRWTNDLLDASITCLGRMQEYSERLGGLSRPVLAVRHAGSWWKRMIGRWLLWWMG